MQFMHRRCTGGMAVEGVRRVFLRSNHPVDLDGCLWQRKLVVIVDDLRSAQEGAGGSGDKATQNQYKCESSCPAQANNNTQCTVASFPHHRSSGCLCLATVIMQVSVFAI